MPRLSIITINYNNLEGLQRTFESVFAQTYQDFEYIVIDGGSTDGSKEVIEQNQTKIDYWVSEKDNGIFNAMNKGTKKINGDFVIYLNSGDAFSKNETLSEVVPFLTDEYDIVYGDLNIVEKDKVWIKKYNAFIDFLYFTVDTLPHQGSFIRKELLKFKNNQVYDERFKLCSDWKFFMDSVCKFNARIKYLDFTIADYDYTGISSIMENSSLIKAEKKKVLEEEYYSFYFAINKLKEENKKYESLQHSRAVGYYFKIRKFLLEF